MAVFSQAAFACGCECGPGVGTPGYWKNHPEEWPVDSVWIGGIEYAKEDAIFYMEQPDAGDKTNTLLTAFVAAKLNLWMQNPSACVKSFVIAGELQMATYPVGSGVAAN